MRWLLRFVLLLAGTAVLLVLVSFGWLYFYSRDLPDISTLAQYAPTGVTQVSDPCLGSSVAIPYEAIGKDVRSAISVVETNKDDPGILRSAFTGLVREQASEKRTTVASSYVSRLMFCAPSRMLNRQLVELRTAIQLERHYSRQQLFTIYANRVPLGPNLVGVHDGAQFYFDKNPADLTISEAALLAGLIKNPSYFSPVKHADRALRRRNEVIDAMLGNGSITADEAKAAKAAPLSIAAHAP